MLVNVGIIVNCLSQVFMWKYYIDVVSMYIILYIYILFYLIKKLFIIHIIHPKFLLLFYILTRSKEK